MTIAETCNLTNYQQHQGLKHQIQDLYCCHLMQEIQFHRVFAKAGAKIQVWFAIYIYNFYYFFSSQFRWNNSNFKTKINDDLFQSQGNQTNKSMHGLRDIYTHISKQSAILTWEDRRHRKNQGFITSNKHSSSSSSVPPVHPHVWAGLAAFQPSAMISFQEPSRAHLIPVSLFILHDCWWFIIDHLSLP